MSRVSSSTITPPEPAIEPTAARVSKSIGMSSMVIVLSAIEPSACFSLILNVSSARKTLAELPPGMTAFNLRPGFIPPQKSLINSPIVTEPTSTSK